MQRSLCGNGGAEDKDVKAASVAACLAWADLTCGPLSTADVAGAVERSLRLDGGAAAARTEVARRVRKLTLPSASRLEQELLITAGVTASVVSDLLRRSGLDVNSSVNV